MFLLNLTWLQLFAVFGGLSVGVVALYLWDRSKRRVAVPTLRFWQPAERAAEVKHRCCCWRSRSRGSEAGERRLETMS